jgi:lipoate-protein ligase A
MRESSFKVPDGKLIKVKLWVSSGKISDIKILGDFFLHPEETLQKLEDSLVGLIAEETSIERTIAKALTSATLIGATAADIAKAIMMAWESE